MRILKDMPLSQHTTNTTTNTTTNYMMMITGINPQTHTSGSLGAGGFLYTTFAIAQLLIDCSLNNILNCTAKSVLSILLSTPILYRLPVGMTDNV